MINRGSGDSKALGNSGSSSDIDADVESQDGEKSKRWRPVLPRWITRFRQIYPDLEVRLTEVRTYMFFGVFYFACRVYFYVDDFTSMRPQPAGVFLTVKKFLPFMGP